MLKNSKKLERYIGKTYIAVLIWIPHHNTKLFKLSAKAACIFYLLSDLKFLLIFPLLSIFLFLIILPFFFRKIAENRQKKTSHLFLNCYQENVLVLAALCKFRKNLEQFFKRWNSGYSQSRSNWISNWRFFEFFSHDVAHLH